MLYIQRHATADIENFPLATNHFCINLVRNKTISHIIVVFAKATHSRQLLKK